MIKLPIVTILAGIAGFILNTQVAFAEDTDPAQCVGASGAAYGLCVAASHLWCGTEDESNAQACSKIAANFLKIAGQTPPWLEYCPCWTIQLLRSQGDFEVCGENFPEVPGSTVFAYAAQGDDFGITGPLAGNPELFYCGMHTDELGLIFVSPITEGEHASCARQVMALCPDPTN